jgi:hypothetical protein
MWITRVQPYNKGLHKALWNIKKWTFCAFYSAVCFFIIRARDWWTNVDARKKDFLVLKRAVYIVASARPRYLTIVETNNLPFWMCQLRLPFIGTRWWRWCWKPFMQHEWRCAIHSSVFDFDIILTSSSGRSKKDFIQSFWKDFHLEQRAVRPWSLVDDKKWLKT